MPLRLNVANAVQRQQFDHDAGPLEFGRGPQRELKRCLIKGDPSVSRDQLLIEELPGGRVRAENLSQRNPVVVSGRGQILGSQSQELDLPVLLNVGQTQLAIDLIRPPEADGTGKPAAERTGSEPSQRLLSIPTPSRSSRRPPVSWDHVTPPDGRSAEQVGRWLERVIELQQTGAGSPEFYDKTAKALVELVGLDLGLVLLQREGAWSIAGSAVLSHTINVHYSKTLLNHVVAQRKTFYEDLDQLGATTSSIAEIESGVAAPIFGLNEDVAGVLYGVRAQQGLASRGPIEPLEAQLVQLLAAAVGANLARSIAHRTQVQFEQFFTRELSEQLGRHPDLLEGRDMEVSLLFCDIRGFSRISERLGPRGTVQWIGDVMGVLSDCVLAHAGVLVDYIGDELVAMWGAPAAQPEHAQLACLAAIDMLKAVPSINERWSTILQEPMALGIGVNSGIARVGNTGSRHKFKYGPLGNTVNLASRIQGATKYLRVPILVTGSTHSQLASSFLSRRLCQVRVVNIAKPVELYELAGGERLGWTELKQGYETALAAFECGDFRRAAQVLSGLLEKWPDDGPCLLLLSRAVSSLLTPTAEFNPVWDLPGK